ncbi:MAG: choice-of-anchor J domain-containing protein, partial [Bacteroidales bacterium]|nr:choice-of-anchor J domain-containing protein [Bacteroidales bacterium]
PIEINDANQLDARRLYNQLVLLRNVEFSPGDIGQEFAPAPPTGSNPTTSDRIFTINGTGSNLTLRTSSACRFFRRPVPAGKGDMLCIYAIYSTTSKTTQQFYLRQLEDLNLAQFDSTALFSQLILWQGFDNGFGNFTAYDAKGSASWEVGLKGDKNYVQVSAYQSGSNEDWLYSPEIELPQAGEYDNILLSFEQAIAYQANPPKDNYTIRISENFSGTGNPREADWTILTIPNPHPGASGSSFTFMNTGDINLNAYAGKKVRVAFLYKNSDGKEPTWEIRKLKIVANK